MTVPGWLPRPEVGSWIYFVVPDHMHVDLEYHDCGTIDGLGDDWGHETWIRFSNNPIPMFASRPLEVK